MEGCSLNRENRESNDVHDWMLSAYRTGDLAEMSYQALGQMSCREYIRSIDGVRYVQTTADKSRMIREIWRTVHFHRLGFDDLLLVSCLGI